MAVQENGKGVLTFRIVSLVGIAIAAVAGVRTWLRSDFADDFSSKQDCIRIEERQVHDRETMKEMAERMRQLADSVNAMQLNSAKLLELYTKALDDKRKE